MYEITCFDINGEMITHLMQWDAGKKIAIKDVELPESPYVHFCNKKSESALVVKPTVEDGSLIAEVPNSLLREPYPIIAYVCEHDNVESTTILNTLYTIIIPVKKRQKPDGWEYVEDKNIVNIVEIDRQIEKLKDDLQTLSTKTFTGSTSSDSGTIGMVPAPQINQNNSVLTGDGNWSGIILSSAQGDLGTGVNLHVGEKQYTAYISEVTSKYSGLMSPYEHNKLISFGEASDYALKTDIPSASKILWRGGLRSGGSIDFTIPEECFHNNHTQVTLVIESFMSRYSSDFNISYKGNSPMFVTLSFGYSNDFGIPESDNSIYSPYYDQNEYATALVYRNVSEIDCNAGISSDGIALINIVIKAKKVSDSRYAVCTVTSQWGTNSNMYIVNNISAYVPEELE